jgi:RNA polymerase sigma-70 factor (ECF subfamily)
MDLEKLTDDQLLKLNLNEKDNKVLSVLYERYFAMVYRFSVKMSRDSELSQDLTQDVFCKAFSNLDSFKLKGENSFKNFLFTITRNEYINYYKKNKRFVRGYIKDNLEETDLFLQPSSEENFLIEERDLLVRNKIDSLKSLSKRIINLRYFQEKSYKEIAEELEMPLGTVQSKLFFIHKDLKKEFLNKKYLLSD